MVRGIWTLAICGMIGLAASAGMGDDQVKLGVDQLSPDSPARRATNQYFSPGLRVGNKVAAPTAVSKPDSPVPPMPSATRVVDGTSTADRKRVGEPRYFSPTGNVTQAADTSSDIPKAGGTQIVLPAAGAPASPDDAVLVRSGVKPHLAADAAAENWADTPKATPLPAKLPPELSTPGPITGDEAATTAAAPKISRADEAEELAPPEVAGKANSAKHADFHAPTVHGAPQTHNPAASNAATSPTTVAATETAAITLEWSKQSEINVGQECECRLAVKNTGKVAAREVAVDVQFPSTTRLIAALPRPSSSVKQLTWNFAEIAAGAEETIGVRLVPSERGELQAAATVRFTSAAPVRFQVSEPMLVLSIKGPKEVMMGDPASQTIMISNPGTGIASNVRIESQIPAGLEHPRGDRLMMEVGSLNPGESRAVRLALAAVEGGHHIIQVSAKADAALINNATAEINVIAPSVKLSLEGPSLRYIGRSAKYTLTVLNDGAAPSNNVRVMHRVPDGFQFVAADNGGKFDPSSMTATWFVGRLEPQQSAKLCIDLLPISVGSQVHHAGVVTEQGTKASAELATEVDGTASLVLEIIDRNDPVEVGTETDYEVRVRNNGSKSAKNVALACELPEGVTFIRANGPADSASANEKGRVVFKNLDQLEPGKTATFRIFVKGRLEGNHRFRARLASDSIQEPLIFEEMTRFYGG